MEEQSQWVPTDKRKVSELKWKIEDCDERERRLIRWRDPKNEKRT